MKSRTEGERVVRRTLADGTIKEYRYTKKRQRSARYDPHSMAALVIAYRQSPEWRALKPSSQRNYSYYLRDLEVYANTPVAALRRRDLLQTRNAISTTRGNGAANLFIKTAKTVLSWARENEWIEHSPADRIKLIEGGHFPAWKPEEAAKAIAELPEHFARVAILALYTGQRRGDLVRMMWSSYDGRWITLKQEKTGAEVAIPVHPVLQNALAEWKRRATSTHILTSEKGVPWTPNHLTELFGRAVAKIGLRPGLNLHGIRKLAAANLADAGCTAHEIAAVTGHRSLAMVQLYTASAQQRKLAEAAISRLQNGNGKRAENDL